MRKRRRRKNSHCRRIVSKKKRERKTLWYFYFSLVIFLRRFTGCIREKREFSFPRCDDDQKKKEIKNNLLLLTCGKRNQLPWPREREKKVWERQPPDHWANRAIHQTRMKGKRCFIFLCVTWEIGEFNACSVSPHVPSHENWLLTGFLDRCVLISLVRRSPTWIHFQSSPLSKGFF